MGKFKSADYVSYIPPVDRPVISLLMFPPASGIPSGFYQIDPDGHGGNRLTLLQQEDFDNRTLKAWYYSSSARAERVAKALHDEGSALCKAIKTLGYSSLPAERLLENAMAEYEPDK